MSDSIRQQIISALDTRLKLIKTTGGYKTNAGNNVFDWLDRDLADTELDAIVYRDRSNEIEEGAFDKNINRLTVEIEAKTKSAATTAAQVRKIIEDIYKAIGTDETFGSLAIQTSAMNDTLDIAQADKIMGSAMVSIKIEYETNRWSY